MRNSRTNFQASLYDINSKYTFYNSKSY